MTIEIGKSTIPATASVVEEEERERLWDRHAAALPWFADYPAKAGRTIPVIRLSARS